MLCCDGLPTTTILETTKFLAPTTTTITTTTMASKTSWCKNWCVGAEIMLCCDGLPITTISETTHFLAPTTTTTTTTIRETTTPLAPRTTSTSTSSVPSSSCIYAALANTVVKGRGTGGKKLRRASYNSDAAYLDACKASCNGDSKCKGFVDDPTDRRGRMCKPKRVTSGYRRPKKAFHVKGSGC